MLSLSSQFLQYFSAKSDVCDVFLVNFSGIANGKFVSGKRGMFGYRPCVASVSHWAGSLDPLNCKSELSSFEVVFSDDGPIRDLITANSVIGKTLIVTLGADPGNDTDFPESAFAPYFGANGGTGGAIISGVTFEPGCIRVQTRDPRSVGFSRNGLAITVPNAAGLPGFGPGGAAVLAMRQILQAGLVSPSLYDATGFSLASNPAIAHLVVDRLRRSHWTQTQTHGTHTMLALSMGGLLLPQATINVYGTDGFPSSGTLIVQSSGGLQSVTYTGITSGSFTGCSGGAGTLSFGGGVSNSIDTNPATSDRSVHDPASLQTLLDEIAVIARGYVLVLEDGLIRFKAFDAAAAAVDRFTALDIIPESVTGGIDDEKVVHSVLVSSAWEGIAGGAGGQGYHFQYLDQDLAALGTWSFSDGLGVIADKKISDQWFSTLGAGDKAVLSADTTITMWSDNFTGLPNNVPASAAVDGSHPGYVFVRGGTTAVGGAMTAGEIIKYTSVTPGAAINNTTNYSVLGGLTRGMFGTTQASHYPAFPTGTVTAESTIAHVTIVDITAIVRAADEIIKRFKGGAGVLRFKTAMTKYGPQLGDVVNAETPVYIRPGLNGLAVGNTVPFEVTKKETDASTKICSWELTEIQAPSRTPHVPRDGNFHRVGPNTGVEDPLFKNAHLPHSIQSSLAGGLVPNIFVDGVIPATSGTLTTIIPTQRVLCAIGAITMPPLNYVFTASKDTYVDLLIADKGQCLWAMTEVANGAAAPALATNRLRAFKVVTSAGAVTGVTDLRNVALVDGGRHIVDLSIISAKLGALSVDSSKLAANSVIAGKILAGTIVDADVNASAGIVGTKLSAGTGALAHVNNSGILDNLTSIATRVIDSLTDGTYAKVLAGAISAGKVNLAAGASFITGLLPKSFVDSGGSWLIAEIPSIPGSKLDGTAPFDMSGLSSFGVKADGVGVHLGGKNFGATLVPYSYVFDVATTNFILNPSFETNTTSWSVFDSAGVSTLARETGASNYCVGIASAKIVTPVTIGTHGIKHADIAAVPGDDCAFSAWVSNIGGQNAFCRMEFYTAGLALIGVAHDGKKVSETLVQQDVSFFTRIGVRFTAPATTAFVRCYVVTTDISTTLYVDGCQLEKGSVTGFTTYCDGSLGPGYSWTGTAHASTSARLAGFHVLKPNGSYPFWMDGSGIPHTMGMRIRSSDTSQNPTDAALEVDVGAYAAIIANPGNNNSGPNPGSLDVTIAGGGPKGRVILGGSIAANGLNVRGGGSSFPASANANDVFLRTDRGILYYYDGTRWLSVNEYSITTGTYTQVPGTAIAATTSPMFIGAVPAASGGTQIYLTGISATWFVNGGGSALAAGTHDWNIGVSDSSGTNFASFNITIFSTVSGAWKNGLSALSGPFTRTISSDIHWRINVTKTGTPGTLLLPTPTLYYRLIG